MATKPPTSIRFHPSLNTIHVKMGMCMWDFESNSWIFFRLYSTSLTDLWVELSDKLAGNWWLNKGKMQIFPTWSYRMSMEGLNVKHDQHPHCWNCWVGRPGPPINKNHGWYKANTSEWEWEYGFVWKEATQNHGLSSCFSLEWCLFTVQYPHVRTRQGKLWHFPTADQIICQWALKMGCPRIPQVPQVTPLLKLPGVYSAFRYTQITRL